ncbi:accessory factor UbiK family protein [Algihabitans albus]|uniref:accessory factor UbiK family protein n=1 Tax=Algihabitans albus TaxID=2164067 RepID=UPI000E5C59B8|nr:accessory factor UbiK family protein [Algihabitans albus]
MQTQNKVIDDLARLASSALGVATGMRHEAEAQFRRQFERILADMDLVTREDYEVTKAIAETARAEQEALAERVAQLEAKLAELSPARKAASKPVRKSTAKTGTKTED